MKFEWQEEHTGKLGWGLKKWVLTRPDIWHIDNIFWDKLSHSWYVKATPIAEENKQNWVDFHVTTAYWDRVTNGVKPHTLID